MNRRPLVTLCALVAALALLGAGCGSANELGVGDGPTTMPLFDTTDPETDATVEETDTEDEGVADSTASTTSTSEVGTSSTNGDGTTSTTSAVVTTIQVDPYAAYCSEYNEFAAADNQIPPGDPDATAALVASQEAAWIALAPLAPATISGEVAIVRDFTTAFRQLLAEYDNDLQAAFLEVLELEELMGAEAPRTLVEQFGLVECGTEPSTPEDETAVFYVSLLDTQDRRTVLAELLSNDGVFSLEGATCFTQQATAEMMFPLAGARSTATQDASLAQALAACQLTLEGSS